MGKTNPQNKKLVKATNQEEYFHNDIFRKYYINLDAS